MLRDEPTQRLRRRLALGVLLLFFIIFSIFFVKKNGNRKNRKQKMKKMRGPCDLALCALILFLFSSNFLFFSLKKN